MTMRSIEPIKRASAGLVEHTPTSDTLAMLSMQADRLRNSLGLQPPLGVIVPPRLPRELVDSIVAPFVKRYVVNYDYPYQPHPLVAEYNPPKPKIAELLEQFRKDAKVPKLDTSRVFNTRRLHETEFTRMSNKFIAHDHRGVLW